MVTPSSVPGVPVLEATMNVLIRKANPVLVLFLISCFAAVNVTADTGKRSLFFMDTVPLSADHSLSAQFLPKNEWRIGKMILFGIAGNLVGIFGGWALGDMLSPKHHSDHIAPGSPLGAMIGSACGSSLWVYLAGSSKDARGKFGSAVGGSLLGMVAAIVVTVPFIGLESGVGVSIGMVAFAILPPVGAAIFFDRSLRSRSLTAGNALLNFSEGKLGLGVPDVHISPLYLPVRDVRADWQFNVRVLSVEL